MVELCISNKDIVNALEHCIKEKQYYIGLFLGKLMPDNSAKYNELMSAIYLQTENNISPSTETQVSVQNNSQLLRVQLLCNWCSSEQLAHCWNKMSQCNYTWNKIKLVWKEPVDYYVIINMPPKDAIFDKKKTIVFRMEPNMYKNLNLWGEWANPNDTEFIKVCHHEKGEYNNTEWHLSKSYSELLNMNNITKQHNILSTVLSGKYKDVGQVKRIDFIKFLEKKMTVHVYGENRWNYKEYKGSLPLHCKDDAIFPYKYTFNVENNNIKNYYTEKLVDGILGECLVFYSGCPNIKDFIDERAYVYLELANFQKDYEKIKKAIEEDWHTQRLPYIKNAKRKILQELQFFPRLEKILASNNNS